MKNQPKKIVYLFGAGATQAELDYQSYDINLLMKDDDRGGLKGVCSRIMKLVKKDKKIKWLYEATRSIYPIDIEQLISLLEDINLEKHRKTAERLRALYYKDILGNLIKTKVFKKPKLSMALFELHQNEQLKKKEKLAGIISLNHDYLLETACQEIYGGLNVGFEFESKVFKPKKDAPCIIKLYGSFNWRSGNRIKIVEAHPARPPHLELLWIPPTIAKEPKSYPFNKLLGTAYELIMLDCDILRVVGCSLRQNDWIIISLLFKTQYLRRAESFDIELIQGREAGEEAKERLGYLRNIKTIAELGGSFSDFLDHDPNNPFEEWLRRTVDEKRINEDDMAPNLKNLFYGGTRTDL